MSYIVVDVEADGPCPGLYSMVSFGAIIADKHLDKTFYAECAPISDNWIPEALAISNISREQHLQYPDPRIAIVDFDKWIVDNLGSKRQIFLSDNLAFDWQFINYYFHLYLKMNPFGFSGRRIGDIYSGLVGDLDKQNEWKKLRKTQHTHNPVDDARGNAEAFRTILNMRKI